jgi:tetratricopeptide (TPR) repeat protein
MKRIVYVLVLLSLLLAGCGASDAPADTPTIAPTDTRAPPTATPEPTATPTPEPTATPEPTPTPTPEPTLGPLSYYAAKPEFDDLLTLITSATWEYNAKYFRWAIGIESYINETYLPNHSEIAAHPEVYAMRAESYSRIGDFEKAIQDLETAVEFPYLDNPSINMTIYNNLCWYLSITGEPERALPYCEDPILMEAAEITGQTAMVLDSIGLTYGIVGRIEESIAAFQEMISLLEEDEFGFYDDMIAQRQEWITAMENGEDPFTPEVLESLRQETIDPAALPEGEVRSEYTFAYFTEFAAQDGFEFISSGTNDAGLPYNFYASMFGECTMLVAVYGDEDQFFFNRLVFMGCTEEQMRGELGWFGRLMLLADPYQNDDDCIPLGQFFAWQITEIDSLITGEITDTSEITINGITFYGYHNEDGDVFLDAGLTD